MTHMTRSSSLFPAASSLLLFGAFFVPSALASDGPAANFPSLLGKPVTLSLAQQPEQEPEATPEIAEVESKWRADFTAWAWLMGLSGDVGVGDNVSNVSATFIDVLEDSDSLFSLSGRAEIGYGRVGAYIDAIYSDIGVDDQTGPGGLASIDVSIEQTIIDFGLMYRIHEWHTVDASANTQGTITLDAYAGARYIRITAEVDPAMLDARTSTEEWVDPIIGARLALPFSEKWSLSLNGDVGGFGVESEFTWSATGVFGYHFSLFGLPAIMTAGYRAIGWDYSTGSGDDEFQFDAVAHGPLLGLTIKF